MGKIYEKGRSRLASCVAIGAERVLRVESVSQSSALSQMRSLTLATG